MTSYILSFFKYVRTFSYLMPLMLCTLFSYALVPQMPPSMPQFSPAEQKQLEAEMAAFQEEFNKLSPQEQESFYQSMEQAVQKIEELAQTEDGKRLLEKLDKGEISDKELDALINQLTGEPAKAEPIEQEPEEVVAPVEAPKPIKMLSSQEEQALNAISSLIISTDSFLVKVLAIPEFPGKVKQWHRKGRISWVSKVQTWADLKNDIEKLQTQLGALIEQDPQTGEYYHLNELLKRESLYNNLRKVQSVISVQEPEIQEVSPLHKMNRVSKKTIQKLINQYIEALYTLSLPDDIATLLKKFEPKAQAAREASERAAKAAEAAAKREPRAPGQPIITGATTEPSYYTPLYEYKEPRAYRPTAHAFVPEEPSRAYGIPSSPEISPFKTPSKTAPKPVTTPKQETVKEAAKKKEEEPGIPKEYQERVADIDKKRQEEIDRLTHSTSDMIAAVAKDIAQATSLKVLETHLTDETPVDSTLVTEIIPGIKRDIQRILDKFKELNSTIRTQKARQNSYDAIKKHYNDEAKKSFDAFEKQINSIEQKFATFKTSIPAEKRYAYFGIKEEAPTEQNKEQDTKQEMSRPFYDEVEKKLNQIAKESRTEEEALNTAVQYLESTIAQKDEEAPAPKEPTSLLEIKRKLPNPISLFDLRNMLRDLKKTLDEFGKGTLKKPKK